MQSKIDYTKYLKEQLRNLKWYMLVLSFVFFTAGPVVTLRTLSYSKENMDHLGYIQRFSSMYIALNGKLVATHSFLFIAMSLGAGIIISILSYSFLHHHNQVSFHYSVPIKRTQVSDLKALAAFIAFEIPMIIIMVLNTLVLFSQEQLTKMNLLGMFLLILLNTAAFLLAYYTTAIAMLLTGKILIGVLGAGVLFCYFPGVAFLYTSLLDMFFRSYISTDVYAGPIMKLCINLSPLALFYNFHWNSILCVLVVIGSIICLYFLTRYLVIRRPAEAAEQSMAYPQVGNIIKLTLTIPISLFIGGFLYGTTNQSNTWFYFGILFGGLLMYTLMQLFYSVEFKRIYAQKLQLLVTLLISAGIGTIFLFDVFGYNTYLPRYDSIKDININFETLFPYGSDIEDATHMGKSEELYDFVKIMIDSNQAYLNSSSEDTQTESIELAPQVVQVRFSYHLNNKKTVDRTYMVYTSDVREHGAFLWENKEFLDYNYPLRTTTLNTITYMHFNSQYIDIKQNNLDITPSESLSFMQALQKDYQNMKDNSMIASKPLFQVDYNASNEQYYKPVIVYEGCTNALDYLDKLGYDGYKPDARYIQELEILANGKKKDILYEEDAIAEELGKLANTDFLNFFHEIDSTNTAIITWTDNMIPSRWYAYMK